jgi:Fur family transcriptional regulator, ferric uptake regulator
MERQRHTAQRQAILEVLQTSSGPLSPQEVLGLAQQKQPGLGLATVYRTLSLLEGEGEIVEVHIPGENSRFEPKRAHHHYFQCQRCERIFDLFEPCSLSILEGSQLPNGFLVRDHHLTLYGLCSECQ